MIDVRRHVNLWLLALVPVLALVMLGALEVGASGIGIGSLLHGSEDAGRSLSWMVMTHIRAPRVVLSAMAGAALGTAGAIMQGLFRNPLADPGLIGVSSGAALVAACVIVLGVDMAQPGLLNGWAVPIAGMAGSFLVTILLYVFATRAGITSVTTVLLAGVAFGAFSGALTGILIFRANDTALRDLTFWTLGSFSGANWERIGLLTPFLLVSGIIATRIAAPLNAMLLGEADAALMGYPVERTKRLAMLAVAASVGPVVAFVGAIGFIGVVVPHLVRLVTGPDHRFVLPGSALLGAILLTAADTVSRVIAAPAELPVGIVTAALGTPVFVWLLSRIHGADIPS
ncbi:iron ABC transporter permease [Gluconobacter frateurii]|uniref:FecCD family ABC transporter permease n=1 Tax=Gluconobacter frateurii TaxID=38308 RepID=UPI001F05C109|nr:iron ABC transporter permease [Gluconobacter frateurii]UMM07699.1 iron ABC transporter permease [Gluconobacter frateurii]